MKYLITGGFGFVGAHLVRAIVQAEPGAQITVVDRAEGTLAGATAARVDLADFAALASLVARVDPNRVVHLASVSSVAASWKQPIVSFSNNTNIYLHLLESVRLHAPRARVLSIGSSEQYGRVAPDDLPLRETAPQRPLSPYAVARVAQEQLGDVYVRGYGLDIVATRSFNHLGPGQSDQFVVSALAKRFAEVARGTRDRIAVGTTSVIRDFLDVRDVVAAYLALLARGVNGEVYNVCSGRGVTIAEVIEMLAVISGCKPAIETDPALVRPVENEVVIGSHEKITAALGWRPTITLEDALRAVYGYWHERS